MEELSRKRWHAMSVQEVLAVLQTNPGTGLADEEVKTRQSAFGKNALPEEKVPSRLRVFLRQFRNPLIFILVFAGIITLFLKHYADSIVIFSAVLLNSSIGYFQEYRATKAFRELKKVLRVKAKVLRQGHEKEIPQEDLVPGDIVILEPGNKVPADGRILESWDLKLQEAQLTGEWLASPKTNRTLLTDTALADRENMTFMGSMVEEGEGKIAVTATGESSEMGKVAQLLTTIRERETPYQIRLAKFSGIIGKIITALALFIFFEGIIVGREFSEMFTVAVAIAVGAIPEGLPVAITAILALGMQRMLKKGGLVRNLTATETLGSTSVIATDKTLTLTEGTMEVEEMWPLPGREPTEVLLAAALASEAFVENPEAVFEKWIIRGRPTDKAILKAALDAGISKTTFEQEKSPVRRIPFESQRRYGASFYQTEKGIAVYLLGAPETLLSFSQIGEEEKQRYKLKLEELAQRGLRVVAAGHKLFPFPTLLASDHTTTNFENLTLVGLLALKDPLRKGVKEAVQLAKRAGIKTLIVTGDHLLTAKAVAKELGIDGKLQECMEGKELALISDYELARRLETIRVYARVEPAQKLKIIEAWQKKGEVIAMTGDGINDAPALQKADIGIALGSGTDVAKETADLVLVGDKFSIIPPAIREGRTIVDNIRKVITYLLSGSFTETILIGASLLLGLPLPMTASQILWINLVEDSLPGIALTFEKGETRAMERKPEGKQISLLTPPMKVIIFAVGIFTDLLLLGLFLWLLHFSDYTIAHIRSVIFVGLALDSLLYVFSCKSLNQNIWNYNLFSNKILLGEVVAAFALLLVPLEAPLFQQLLHTTSLSLQDWAVLFSLATLNVFLIEGAKWVFIRR